MNDPILHTSVDHCTMTTRISETVSNGQGYEAIHASSSACIAKTSFLNCRESTDEKTIGLLLKMLCVFIGRCSLGCSLFPQATLRAHVSVPRLYTMNVVTRKLCHCQFGSCSLIIYAYWHTAKSSARIYTGIAPLGQQRDSRFVGWRRTNCTIQHRDLLISQNVQGTKQ